IDYDPPSESSRRRISDRFEIILCRQGPEDAIDEFAGRFLIDVADNGHLQLVSREDASHIVAHVIARYFRHRIERALPLAPVSLARKGGLPPAAASGLIGVRD